MIERVILEGKNTDIPIRARSRQMTTYLRRRPGNEVDRGGVQRELVYALPLVVLLSPYQDAAVVG